MESERSGKYRDAPNAHGEADKESSQPNPKIPIVVREPDLPPAKPKDNTTKQKKRDGLDYFKFALEVIGLIALIVYTGYTIRMYMSNEKAAGAAAAAVTEAQLSRQQAEKAFNATVEQFRLDQRAWVGPKSVNKISIKPNTESTIDVILANTGKTPALHLETHFMLHLMPANKPMTFAYTPPKQRVVDTLYPQGEMTIVTSRFALTAPQIENLKSGTSILYAYGKISYRDVFGASHMSTFCLSVTPDLLNANSCDAYNTAN